MQKIIIRIISLILLILTCAIIFKFSSQTGESSGGISEKVSRVIVEIFTDNNISEEEKVELTFKIQPVIRKLAHFSLYALVGIFACGLVCTYNISWKYRYIISILFGFVYAITDEIHQSFIPDRSPKLLDVGIDALGTIFGTFLVWCIIVIYKKLKSE